MRRGSLIALAVMLAGGPGCRGEIQAGRDAPSLPLPDAGGLGPDAAGAGSDPVVDGTAFPSLQAAIDSLEGAGGAVYIPPGEHRIPEKLRVHGGVTVFGAGMDQTVLRFEDGVPEDHMIANDSTTGRDRIVIRDLTLFGPGAGDQDRCCYGVKLESVEEAWVIDVRSVGHGVDGFYLGYKLVDGEARGVSNVRLSGVVAAENGRNGISVTHGRGVIIDRARVEENNRNEVVAGIDLEPDEDLAVIGTRIVDSSVRRNPGAGIQLLSLEEGWTVDDNAVCRNQVRENGGTGLVDLTSGTNYFVDNEATDNGADEAFDDDSAVGSEFADRCGPLPDLPERPKW